MHDLELKALVAGVFRAPATKQLHAAASVTKFLVRSYKQGKITRQLACYYIAEFMFLEPVDADENMAAICDIAGRLELPDNQLSDSDLRDWSEFLVLVERLQR